MTARRGAAYVAVRLAVGMALLATAGCGDAGQPTASGQPGSSESPAVALAACEAAEAAGRTSGDPPGYIPDVTLPCLGHSSAVALPSMVDGPTVVTLWASWCAQCVDELPVMDDLAAEGAVRVMGVVSEDSVDSATAFAQVTGLGFPSLVDTDASVRRAFGVPGLPVTLFVRGDGTVAHVHAGPPLDGASLRDLVEEHLGVTT